MPKTTPRRQVRRLPPEQRVADILAAAKAEFDEKGYADALITDIAARAGVVEGSIYRFFSNKRELLYRVVEQWYDDMLARHATDFPAVQGAWNRLRYIVHQHLLSVKAEPGLAKLMLQEIRLEPGYRDTRFFELNQTYSNRIVDVVREGVASGEFADVVSPSFVRDVIFGCTEHRAWAFLRKEGDFDPGAMTESIMALLRNGLAPQSPAPQAVAPAPDDVVTRLEKVAADLEKVSSALGATRTRKG